MTDEPASSITADPALSAAAASAISQSGVEVMLDTPEWKHRIPFVERFVGDLISLTLTHAAGDRSGGSSPTGAGIAVLLSTDDRLRQLNHQFRGRDNATNVLSFPQTETPSAGVRAAEADEFIGDIAVAFETLEREAQEADIELKSHLAHMIVHGCLHLLGHTHDGAEDCMVMEKLESEILKDVGIEDPHAGRHGQKE